GGCHQGPLQPARGRGPVDAAFVVESVLGRQVVEEPQRLEPGRGTPAVGDPVDGYGAEMIDDWTMRARAFVRDAGSGAEGTADGLHDGVGPPEAEHKPNGRNNRVGSVFMWARRQGYLVDAGHAPSRQPHRRGGMIRKWRRV